MEKQQFTSNNNNNKCADQVKWIYVIGMLPPMTTNADKQGPIVECYNPKGLKHRMEERALGEKLLS